MGSGRRAALVRRAPPNRGLGAGRSAPDHLVRRGARGAGAGCDRAGIGSTDRAARRHRGSSRKIGGPVLLILASLMFASGSPPDGTPCVPSGGNAPAVGRTSPRWNQPLDRIVSFHAADLSLREALDRLAAAARVRLSYSSESLALDRLVCASLDSVALG